MIVLDTHALLWWISNPERIPSKARRQLDRALAANSTIAASCISSWEISVLVQRRRLELTIPVDAWIAHAEELPWMQFVPVDNRVALRSTQFEGFPHRDPADRLIVATTLILNKLSSLPTSGLDPGNLSARCGTRPMETIEVAGLQEVTFVVNRYINARRLAL